MSKKNNSPNDICSKYITPRFFPVSIDEKIITVGFTDPSEPNCLDAAKEFFGEDLPPVLVRSDFIHNFISRYKSFCSVRNNFTGSVSVGKGTFQSIISEAIEREGVTDVYIEPMRDRLLIKFRQILYCKETSGTAPTDQIFTF